MKAQASAACCTVKGDLCSTSQPLVGVLAKDVVCHMRKPAALSGRPWTPGPPLPCSLGIAPCPVSYAPPAPLTSNTFPPLLPYRSMTYTSMRAMRPRAVSSSDSCGRDTCGRWRLGRGRMCAKRWPMAVQRVLTPGALRRDRAVTASVSTSPHGTGGARRGHWPSGPVPIPSLALEQVSTYWAQKTRPASCCPRCSPLTQWMQSTGQDSIAICTW